jgi:hypothetical protein
MLSLQELRPRHALNLERVPKMLVVVRAEKREIEAPT